jgi:protein-disulfide isomerase
MLTDLRALVRHPVAATLALLFVGGAGTAIAFFPRDAADTASPAQAAQAPAEALSADQRAQVAKAFDEQPRVNVPVDAAGAKVLIVKFNDFQCPACGHTHQLYKPILQKYEAQAPGQVRLIAKDYPLETECNPTMKRDVHAAACEAAVAVRLAQGPRRTALEDWLFSHQQEMTPESVRAAARDVGGITDLEPRYKATLEAVKADATLGTELQVNSTPTFFVNGVKIPAVQPAVLDAIIEHELSKAAQAK